MNAVWIALQSASQALEAISWPQAMVTLGLALNTTLTAVLLHRRNQADNRDTGEYMSLRIRLRAIEEKLEQLSEDCPKLNSMR